MGPQVRSSSPAAAGFPQRPATLLLSCLAVLGVAAGALADDANDPFATRAHPDVRGVVQAWAMQVSDCPGGESDLLVLGAVGGPPQQKKHVTWMPCGSAVRPDDPAIVRRVLGPEIALVDVGRVPGRPGPQLFQVSATGLRVESLSRTPEGPARDYPVPGGLPLPARPRQLSRIVIVDDWHSTGQPVALVPAADGGRLIDLASGAVRRLPMPLFANYRSWDPFLPRTIWTWLFAETRWPTLAREDDNGDGRLDLFALSRWEIWVYHAGPDGLPSAPNRKIPFVPFDEAFEQRHESTAITYFARDLNGDARADLILNSVGGGLSNGRSTTHVHLNSGQGVSTSGRPAAFKETPGGFADVSLIDLDGDGRDEIVELSLEFGVLQVVGLLLTGKMDITLNVLRLDREAPTGLRTEFSDELSFEVDLGSARIEGLVPTLGDWNGDGVQDLYVIKGSDAISFRLGAVPGVGPRFGRAVGRQPLPLASGESRIADLDGDGLDDIVAFEHAEADSHLVVLHNRGRLPGTRPTLRAQD